VNEQSDAAPTEVVLRPLAVVTGASAGIGEAIATRLADEGFRLILGARREDRLQEVADRLGAEPRVLDVSDETSVAAFCAGIDRLELLVNNAGGARGLDPLAAARSDTWRWMWEVNVLGLMQMTRALLPALEASGRGHIVNVSSTAGLEVYEGGSGYQRQTRGPRHQQDAPAGAGGAPDPGHRGLPRDGGDRLQPQPL